MCIYSFQCVPYLIAMGTDPETTMKNKADQQLLEIDKKYSGFIHVSGGSGMEACCCEFVEHALSFYEFLDEGRSRDEDVL